MACHLTKYHTNWITVKLELGTAVDRITNFSVNKSKQVAHWLFIVDQIQGALSGFLCGFVCFSTNYLSTSGAELYGMNFSILMRRVKL